MELPHIQEFTRAHYGKVCTNLLMMERRVRSTTLLRVASVADVYAMLGVGVPPHRRVG